MDLRANDLTGQIPSQLGHLSKLGEDIPCNHYRYTRISILIRHIMIPKGSLQLHANELSGAMPQEICDLRSDMLNMLVADCRSDNEFDEVVTCDEPKCCTRCY